MAIVLGDDDESTFCIEFSEGLYGEGASVSQALQLHAVEMASQGQLCAQGCSVQQHPVPAGPARLSVKRFSRRQLLLTGGIATRVWTASVLLSRWMARHMSSMRVLSHLSTAAGAGDMDRGIFGSGGGRVLELGCGLGVAGIAAAMCGCKVLLTDVHDVALSACRDAIRINADRLKSCSSARAFSPGGHVRSIDEFLRASESGDASGQAFTMELDWNHLPELAPHQRFSCLIAADVVHEDQHAPLISKVIRQMLAPSGVCLLCNADEHSRYGMDAFPRQLQEEGLQVKLVVPLPLLPPASGEDETLADVLQHHIMVITHA